MRIYYYRLWGSVMTDDHQGVDIGTRKWEGERERLNIKYAFYYRYINY